MVLQVISGVASVLSSTWAWIVMIGVSGALLFWNGGRNLTCWLFFVGSVLPIPLIAEWLPYFDAHALRPVEWLDLPPLVAGGASIILLLASALSTGWSLVRRVPLQDEFGALVLLGIGYGPVIVLLSAWALAIFVLALVGF